MPVHFWEDYLEKQKDFTTWNLPEIYLNNKWGWDRISGVI
jgi:hypothetical protein